MSFARRTFLQLAGAAIAAQALSDVAAAQADRVDGLISKQMTNRRVPGLAIAVIQNDKMVKAQGYGYADLQHQKPATSQTVFQLASVTKQFVASGVMLLVQDGKISTGAPIADYLNNLPRAWNRITVRHLLTHTSGIEDYLSSTAAAGTDLRRDPELRTLVRTMRLQFQPGEKWQYSNSNYLLLGHLIERISGKPYDRFLIERVFRPIGMGATRRRVVGDSAMAVGYMLQKDGRAPKEAPFLPPALWDNADGGLVSTVEDMAKWDHALFAGTVVSKSSIEEMYTRTKLNDGMMQDYGYGMILNVLGKHRIVGHGGSRPGVATNFTRWLDDGISVVVLCNAQLGANDPYEIARSIAKLYVAQVP